MQETASHGQERAAHILDLIDEKWPTAKEQPCSISLPRDGG
jgi:hypothetical protein